MTALVGWLAQTHRRYTWPERIGMLLLFVAGIARMCLALRWGV